MRLLFATFLAAFVIAAVPVFSFGQESAVVVAPQDAEPDLEACEQWKKDSIASVEKELEENSDAYKQASKSRDRDKMKTLLARKKELAKKLEAFKAKTPEECREAVVLERDAAEKKRKETDRQRAVWDSADNAEKARREVAAAKAAEDRKFILRHREFIKKGKNILTRDEFKELVRKGMKPSDVIRVVGSPDKTEESGDLKSFIYYKKTIDEITGNEDAVAVVNFWHGEVKSVTCQ